MYVILGLPQVQSQQELINLLDYAIYIRNVSFFILVLVQLRRVSIKLDYIDKEDSVIKISGPSAAEIGSALKFIAHNMNSKYSE